MTWTNIPAYVAKVLEEKKKLITFAPLAYVICFVTYALDIKARVFVGSKPFQTRLVLASKADIFGGLLALPANIKLGTNFDKREKKCFVRFSPGGQAWAAGRAVVPRGQSGKNRKNI